MNRRFGVLQYGFLLSLLLILACQSPPPPPPSAPPPEDFSSANAWRHLQALTEMGPRISGTRESKQAREYLRGELTALGLEVKEQRVPFHPPEKATPLELVNLIAEIPGRSDQLILLASHYDTPRKPGVQILGANEGASGPAVLLELARVLTKEPLRYTVRIVLTDGDSLAQEFLGLQQSLPGSWAWAEEMKKNHELNRVKLLVVLDQVADRDLVFTRDLFSNRIHRETFWRVAAELGYEKSFPARAEFESQALAHQIFDQMGMRSIVALADSHYGDDTNPGPYWRTENDIPEHCAQESLEISGRVTLKSVRRIAKKLTRLERFSTPVPSQSAEELESDSVPPQEKD